MPANSNLPRPIDKDSNPLETQEWLEALDDVLHEEGTERACFLLQ